MVLTGVTGAQVNGERVPLTSNEIIEEVRQECVVAFLCGLAGAPFMSLIGIFLWVVPVTS